MGSAKFVTTNRKLNKYTLYDLQDVSEILTHLKIFIDNLEEDLVKYNENNELKDKIKDLEEKLDDANSHIREFERDEIHYEERIDSLKNDIEWLEDEIKEYQNDFDDL